MFDVTKFGLICKIIVSIILFVIFSTLTVISLVGRYWAAALLSLIIAIYIGYIAKDTLLDYWDYTEVDKK